MQRKVIIVTYDFLVRVCAHDFNIYTVRSCTVFRDLQIEHPVCAANDSVGSWSSTKAPRREVNVTASDPRSQTALKFECCSPHKRYVHSLILFQYGNTRVSVLPKVLVQASPINTCSRFGTSHAVYTPCNLPLFHNIFSPIRVLPVAA